MTELLHEHVLTVSGDQTEVAPYRDVFFTPSDEPDTEKTLTPDIDAFRRHGPHLKAHEYVEAFPTSNGVATELIRDDSALDIMGLLVDVLETQQKDPVDVIIGDDVSGRIPTLIVDRFLKLAQAGGHVDTIPRTFFMASGHHVSSPGTFDNGLSWEENRQIAEDLWSGNLTEHATKIAGEFAVSRAMLITEIVSSGISIERLESAFANNDIETLRKVVGGEAIYLKGHGSETAGRKAVGVEKYSPEAISRRAPEFESEKVRLLRSFISEYTKALYVAVIGEAPPELSGFTHVYAAKPKDVSMRDSVQKPEELD
ncbi:hypothetical protein KA529_04465 [Candidatus Saccharibacteria bacterium]|nr:hypothetical protein [Candidatus Saccharibacteria bacterium]